MVPRLTVEFCQNITVHGGEKSGMPFGCILREHTFHIDNCEFHSGLYTALLIRYGDDLHGSALSLFGNNVGSFQRRGEGCRGK